MYLIAFAVGNLLGPLTARPPVRHHRPAQDDRRHVPALRRAAGDLGGDVRRGLLNAVTQTLAWCVIFFFASAGASAAYLTVSEIFPLEVRAQAIAVFFAIAQCFGAIGPIFYGALIGDGSDPGKLFIGYLIGAGVMIIGGLVEVFLGVDAEGKSLEDVAAPLSAVRSTAGVTAGFPLTAGFPGSGVPSRGGARRAGADGMQ